MVLGVFSGERPTGGYQVEITRTERTNTGLTVYYREEKPPADALVIQVIRQPYHLIRLPREEALPVFLMENP